MSNMTETTLEEEEDEPWLLPLYSLIPAVICIGGMIILAVGGNILIIVSYFRDKQLQTVHNMYILNLAFTDLFLGCISMPFYAVYTVTVWHWPFGRVVCKFFLVVDFTLCLESVLLIIVISLDRLILVTKGAFYMSQETFKVGKVKLVVSWLFSFALYSPAIIGWDYWVGESAVEPGDCDVEFFNNFNFTLVTSLIEFAVPFISISVLNILIYMKIRQRKKIFANNAATGAQVPQNTPSASASENTDMNERRIVTHPQTNTATPGDTTEQANRDEVQDNPQTRAMTYLQTNKPSQGDTSTLTVHANRDEAQDSPETAAVENLKTDIPSQRNTNTLTVQGTKRETKDRTLKKSQPTTGRRDLKAARALAVLVLALAVCWAPYTIATLTVALCEDCVNVDFYEFLNWLLWFKSCINPFLYALNSVRFRDNMKKLLFCWRRH